ncbi:hypothetical protein JQS43_22750 [Natronosporangium hydrolyticum]|uniref:Uncharacterized protein n=1 Tax=Natronosporangium hydrolyticum TaxID=2811111 RepID=A0A895YDP4_9ACTN|nr:hypothetical protein [Natronosporangium hydrolyticum]QSB14292.1 hypothetical protein JQS43_22750 [Natronosporangium hydrolyticum]
MSQPTHDSAADPEQPEQPESAEPLNRAERRAQQRGKKLGSSQEHGPSQQQGRPQPILSPRRAGRRGNR